MTDEINEQHCLESQATAIGSSTIEAALQLLYRSLAGANLSRKIPTALAAKLYSKVTSGGWQMAAVVLVILGYV